MATNYASIIPVEVSREVVQMVMTGSAVMKLARTIRMPTGTEKIPVLSVAPHAAFVNPTYGGRKPIASVEWTSEQIVAEEIALTLSIPNAFIDDSGFPVWENVRPLVANAIQRCFDAAALYGTGAPASYPAGGLIAPAFSIPAAAGSTTIQAGVDAAFGAIEAEGLAVNGVLGGPALNGLFRSLSLQAGMPMSDVSSGTPSSLWGVPFSTTPVWDNTKGDALVGDWSYVVIGIREDIQVDLSADGVLTDPAGAVVVNAFQDDSTLMRAYMRVGMVVGLPLGPDGATVVKPLALADHTASP